MIAALDWTLAVAAALLLVPALVLLAECLLARHPRARGCRLERSAHRPRTAVLVPARDEEPVIGATLALLKAELAERDRLLVVADGCSDRTAEVARAAGAEVVERDDPSRPGKGHALAFGLEHLAQDPPEAVVVVDADCVPRPGSVEVLARHAVGAGAPVQAEYVLLADEPRSPAALSALAFSLKNRVRPAGLRALGLPCPLTGSGMGFPFELLRQAPVGTGRIVEDLHLGLDLALAGVPPRSCPEAAISGLLPGRDSARRSQRRRWEHGSLEAAMARVPSLAAAGLRRGRLDLLAVALDLCVPPLALLVALLAAAGLAGGLVRLLGGYGLALVPAVTGLLAVIGAVAIGLGEASRGVASPAVLLSAPRYVLDKLPLYLDLVRRGPEKRWIRTDRGRDAAAT